METSRSLIILMGPTGAGKTVLGSRLAIEHGWAHISSGELLRQRADHGRALANGQLAPSTEVEQLVMTAIREAPLGVSLILDGFPRTLDEATWLQYVSFSLNIRVDVVIVLTVKVDELLRRLERRGRDDDSPTAIKAKLDEYNIATEPVIAWYEKAGILKRINSNDVEDVVYSRIKKVIGII